MRTRSITLSLACLTLTALLAAPALSQDKDYKTGQKADAQQMSPEELAWTKAGTPNENHHRLNYAVGKWNCTVKSWEPGAEQPKVSKGTDVTKWILDNRYQATEFKGEYMGMPFAGRGITGYDNIDQRYFSIWFDTLSTGPMTETGTYDESTKTFTFTGDRNSPTGSKMYSRTVIKIVSDDEHVLTMYHGETSDKLTKAMEITYARDRKWGAAPAASGMKVVLAGCGSCQFKMPGVSGCKLAVKVDGKAYLVSGSDVSAHAAGLCDATKKAEIAGKVDGDEFAATSFTLKD